MADLTLAIDENVLRRARERAVTENTSVDAVVRGFLESYAKKSDADTALAEIVALAEQSTASSGPEGRIWRREDLYEERLGRYGKR